MNAVISANHLEKRYGKLKVLNDVSFEVPEGVVYAVLGENGAGKSTLIQGLLGYHKFNSGDVSVLGCDPIAQTMQLRRQVGYVSDSPGLYEWMTVAQAGWYASGFYPEGFLSRYDELTREFNLRQDAKIRDLSKGMRAKVALSLAMAFNPRLLILDEPTSGLDPVVRRAFLESMIDRAAAGQTVFLSSHQIHEVERVADWVAIVHQGRLQIAAPLEELKNDVSMLSFALRDPLLAEPEELSHLRTLSHRKDGRSVECMVFGASQEKIDKIRANENVFDVKSVRPNLEELYIGFTSDSTTPVQEKQSVWGNQNELPNDPDMGQSVA